jgi:molecular chaperone GrpE
MHTLETYGIVEFDPIGKKYDANFHTALFLVHVEGKEAGTVFEVQKTGYMIKDRVLRSASVGVVKECDN